MSREDISAHLSRRTPGGGHRRIAAVTVGVLVLMTIWGFGRAWHGGIAPVELFLGVASGCTVIAAMWPRKGSRRTP